jgi:hypothetical protein
VPAAEATARRLRFRCKETDAATPWMAHRCCKNMTSRARNWRYVDPS